MAHALILGASGISGWAVLTQALDYPTPTTFTQITGTTNRPLSRKEALIPNDDPRVNLVHGIDFTKSVDVVTATLKEKIPSINTVTHVFFTAYIVPSEPGPAALKKANDSLLQTAILSITTLSPLLKSVILQTGGKAYGLLFTKHIKLTPPFHESLPRVPSPWGDEIFYYSQYDILASLSRGKSWTFTEIRPDTIIGFVPGTNAMNLAQGLGFYLCLFREVFGVGATCVFPGTEAGYRSKHTDSSQDMIAKLEIFSAVNVERCGGGRSFNVADGKVVTWVDIWPGLCSYFGLEGEEPKVEGEIRTTGQFVLEHAGLWEGIRKLEGLREMDVLSHNWWFVDRILQIPFDRQFDLESCREVGFKETVDSVKGYTLVFDRMREARMIPRF